MRKLLLSIARCGVFLFAAQFRTYSHPTNSPRSSATHELFSRSHLPYPYAMPMSHTSDMEEMNLSMDILRPLFLMPAVPFHQNTWDLTFPSIVYNPIPRKATDVERVSLDTSTFAECYPRLECPIPRNPQHNTDYAPAHPAMTHNGSKAVHGVSRALLQPTQNCPRGTQF
jgi:hypothetical protein